MKDPERRAWLLTWCVLASSFVVAAVLAYHWRVEPILPHHR